MVTVMYAFFILSCICIAGMFYFISKLNSPGIYPPKIIIKKNARMLGAAAVFLFFLGFILRIFT
ncbi:hypothetical protein [Peribacillus sp. SCS-155]|uniref:hypothetical protein n=1 Tax=Peribacillus sedimenti TaxID=3115297 RepID=UPI003906122F